ncbi:MAG: crossover junction endodeoxyribonuclease RuvC [Candidatus Peribacteraceae bacterium]|jgi:crossover junction endodeoxyribonuclease RuvC|nr:crossover junction endodeoxyribonuclease RuvC [Candidatus Peribacteraceae bacterium]|tara:strand:- start:4513 stop:4992 length:480 start_codon:yes stop_codon:yes gene_type:complete
MKIIGIDPGLATTGIGLLETDDSRKPVSSDWFTIETPARTPLSDRLAELEADLTEYLNLTNPDLAVVERLFFATNEKTALDVAHARGVILLSLKSHQVQILEPTPLELKSCITGDGKADKIQVQNMIMRELKLNEPPKPDDATDALALALFGVYQNTFV